MRLNPRQVQAAMKQLGVQQTDVPATRVVIYGPDKEIHIPHPHVVKVSMMGEEHFQVSGAVQEVVPQVSIREEDIMTVVQQAHVDKELARETIQKHNGDLAAAILDLTG